MDNIDFESIAGIFDTMPLAFTIIEVILDDCRKPVDFRFVYLNRELELLEEVPKETLLGARFYEVFSNTDEKWLEYYYSSAYEGRQNVIHSFSPEIGKHLKIISYQWPGTNYCACILSDETQLVQMQKRLEEYGLYDNQTGLLNRNSYIRYCEEYSLIDRRSAGVIFTDINGLKKCNDDMGHDAGDSMIMQVTTQIHRIFDAAGQKTFRMSGDEFLIVWEDCSREEIMTAADIFEASMLDPCSGRQLAAVGSSWSADSANIEGLVKLADTAMYEKKRRYYQDRADCQ